MFYQKRFLLLYFWLNLTFFANATPNIILLMGPVNSGKSIISKELSQYNDWYSIEEDIIYYRELPKFLARTFPESYQKINKVIKEKNILNAVKRGQYCFKRNASNNEKKEALTAIKNIQLRLDHGLDAKKLSEEFHAHLTELLLNEVDTMAGKKKYIIIDTWMKQTLFALQEKYPEKSITRVFVHKPILKSYAVFYKRNQIAQKTKDLRECRFWDQWLRSNDRDYEFLYEKKANYLSFISWHDLKSIFNIIRKQIIQTQEDKEMPLFSRREMNLLDLKHYERIWLGTPIKDDSVIFLYAKQEYDLIILNDDTPANLALKIKEHVEKE